MITVKNLKKSFGELEVLKKIDCEINKGECIVVIGPSGSGKSTFLRCLNRLEEPTGGQIIFDGTDILDKGTDINKIRQKLGMVFQHFNLFNHLNVMDNLTLAPVKQKLMSEADAKKKAVELLKRVGLEEKAENYPAQLSGGQKQRVSIAGVLAMHPKCIVLDEPTAMLDPQGRKEVIRAVRALNEVENITIILITHYMEEVVYADKVFVMDKGSIKMEGTPREIFSRVDELQSMRLTVPQVTLLAEECRKMGMPFSKGILTTKEFMEELKCLLS